MFVNWLLLAWRKTLLFLYKLTLCNQRQQNTDVQFVLSQLTTENNILSQPQLNIKCFLLQPHAPHIVVESEAAKAAVSGLVAGPGELWLVESWSRDRSAHCWLVQGPAARRSTARGGRATRPRTTAGTAASDTATAAGTYLARMLSQGSIEISV